jgi:hypothetical protein
MIANWVRESITSAGTGDIYLNGTFDGFIKFSDAFINTQKLFYSVIDGTNRETGIGTYDSANNQITRTVIFATLVVGVHNVSSPEPMDISIDAVVDCMVSSESVTHHAIATKERIIEPIFLNDPNEGAYVNTSLGYALELPVGVNKLKIYSTGIPRDMLIHDSASVRLELLVQTAEMAATSARLNISIKASVAEAMIQVIQQSNTPDNVNYNIISVPMTIKADALKDVLEVSINRTGTVEDTFTGSVNIGLVRFVYESQKVGDVGGMV